MEYGSHYPLIVMITYGVFTDAFQCGFTYSLQSPSTTNISRYSIDLQTEIVLLVHCPRVTISFLFTESLFPSLKVLQRLRFCSLSEVVVVVLNVFHQSG